MAYDFIFWVVYNQKLKKGKSEAFSIYNGNLIVGFSLVVHTGLIFAMIKYILIHWFDDDFSLIPPLYSKLSALGVLSIPFWYYNDKRVEKVKLRYAKIGNSSQLINGLIVLSIIFIPLLMAIFISSRYY